jgi:hypothetical protein
MRRNYAQEVGGSDPRVYFSQDYSLSLRMSTTGPFVEVNEVVAYFPENVPGRVSSNQGRELQQGCLACVYFFMDFPDKKKKYLAFAARRCTGRAWKFAHRHKKANVFSRSFFHYILSRVPFLGISFYEFLLKESLISFE